MDMAGAAMFLYGVGFEVNNEAHIMQAKIETWDMNVIMDGMRMIEEKKELLLAKE